MDNKYIADLFLVSEDRIKTETYLDANVNPDAIRVAALHIQNVIIERVLGTCLTNQLKKLVCTGEICLEDYACYKDLIDNYLYNIFNYGIQAELIIPLSYKTRNQGLIQVEGETFRQPSMSDTQYTEQFFRNRMDFYIIKCVDYLRCNCGCFKSLCNCGGCCSNEAPYHKDLSLGLYLGPTNSEYRHLNKKYHIC